MWYGKRSGRCFIFRLVLVALAPATAGLAQDHPLITPYAGSKLHSRSVKEFEKFELVLGARWGTKVTRSERLEGRVTHLEYRTPKERSELEVYQNYRAALVQAGFEALFECAGYGKAPDNCGDKGGHYLASRLPRPDGDAYVALSVSGYQTWLTVVEVNQMESGKVKVSAEAISGDLSGSGHATIYGIYFDVDRAELRPDSRPTIEEIARLPRETPALRLFVVGHTDSTGDWAHNVQLSERRAQAVVRELVEHHGIAAERLTGAGVGPLAPVASNRSEEGRARNRRVELVER